MLLFDSTRGKGADAMNRREWLSSLKGGEQVVIEGGFSSGSLSVAKVARITATQIILDSGDRFRRENGRRVGEKTSGGTWSHTSLSRPTPELLESIRKRFLVDKLRGIQWGKHGIEILERVYMLAKNGQPKTD